MKALLIQTEYDIDNHTGKFSVATQWGHIGNDCWLYEGVVMTRHQLESTGYGESPKTITEAELIVKEER